MDTPHTDSFGYWLRRHRKALDWTQADLARRVNCAAATIRKIEADERKPSRQLAESLATQLNVPAAQRAAFLHAARQTVAPNKVMRDSVLPFASRAPNNLPAPMTALINRVRDIASVTALLTRAEVRLLTLIGPPGIGKTRLCLQSCENVIAHFPDGVWFVDLAPLNDAALVLPTIARALNIAESGALTPLQQLAAILQDRHVLLALDNFEQVVESARAASALLKMCKGLKILATSRVALQVYGEHEYAVPPLALPPRDVAPNELLAFEAAQLFSARVREHQPRFAITPANTPRIAEVCIQLDGVPLALELAAAALRQMSLDQLVAAFAGAPNWLQTLHTPARDLPLRQQTLYNAIAWSYSLLDAPTQTIFRQLGIFTGGFDADAARAVGAADAATLATLTNHNLLAREADRWRLLEMIREFALEQLRAEDRAEIEQRHAIYFADHLQKIPCSAIERDHANYLAALRWAIHARDGLLALAMGDPLTDFWETRGYLREGLMLAHEVLAIAENADPGLRIDFLRKAANLAWHRHEFATALALAEQAIALARTTRLEEKLPYLFHMLGRIYLEQGDYARAEQTLRDSIQLAEKLHRTRDRAIATANLGEVALAFGRLDEAQALSEQALVLLENERERFTAMAHTNLAEVALARGNYAMAREELRRALPYIHSHVRRLFCFLATLAGWLIGQPHARQENMRRGAELFGAIAGLTERTGASLSAMYRILNETRIEIVQRRLTDREWQAAWHQGYIMTNEQIGVWLGKQFQNDSVRVDSI